MDISSGSYVDLLLNLIGYMAAGAMVWTIYPIVAPKLKRRSAASAQPAVQSSRPAVIREPEAKLQFMRLQSQGSDTPSAAIHNDRPAERSTALRPSERRDRVDIIRIAREMLRAGADNKRIQQVLPVSEAELALLTMQSQ